MSGNTCVFIILSIVCISQHAACENTDIQTTLTQLTKRIDDLQSKRDTIVIPPLLWKHYKGLYASHVKLNFHGPPQMAALRDGFAVLDNNMFATAWITSCLLEAKLFGKDFGADESHIQLAIEAIGKFHDHNRKYTTTTSTFWPQVYNDTTKMWGCAPGNLLSLFDLTDVMPVKIVEELLKAVGLNGIAEAMQKLLQMKDLFSSAFHIPPDFDDTFVNIGLGSLLAETSSIFPKAFQQWNADNTNISSAFDALRKYAYRPYSNDSRVNTIDTRTYFYLHEYLQSLNGSDVAFVPTWIQNIEEAEKNTDKGVGMPFSVNNVDITVATNTIYGITASLIHIADARKNFDSQLQKIYTDTADLINYEIGRNFSGRRDLALTYYPPKFECYWFASRILALLRRTYQVQPLPFQIMETIMNKLETTFHGHVTDDIIKSSNSDAEGYMYFDDFLGNGDYDTENKSVNRAEDRLFTTAMAANTLLTTWTERNLTSGRMSWVKEKGSARPLRSHLEAGAQGVNIVRRNSWDTPGNVKTTVAGSINWLNENIFNSEYKPWNAFFSGSGKGMASMPFWYPYNRLEFLNGTKYHGDVLPHGLFLQGFQGVASDEEYNKLLQKPTFGRMTPIDFHGFNPNDDPTGYFPFWSSDAYTYATTALALSRYINIE